MKGSLSAAETPLLSEAAAAESTPEVSAPLHHAVSVCGRNVDLHGPLYFCLR